MAEKIRIAGEMLQGCGNFLVAVDTMARTQSAISMGKLMLEEENITVSGDVCKASNGTAYEKCIFVR